MRHAACGGGGRVRRAEGTLEAGRAGLLCAEEGVEVAAGRGGERRRVTSASRTSLPMVGCAVAAFLVCAPSGSKSEGRLRSDGGDISSADALPWPSSLDGAGEDEQL
jgi:hypothetical protein